MKALNKNYLDRIAALETALGAAEAGVDNALDTFQGKVREAWSPVSDAIDALNAIRQEAEDLRQEVHDAQQEYMDERSEKWQESEAAANYQEWMDAWDNPIEPFAADLSSLNLDTILAVEGLVLGGDLDYEEVDFSQYPEAP